MYSSFNFIPYYGLSKHCHKIEDMLRSIPFIGIIILIVILWLTRPNEPFQSQIEHSTTSYVPISESALSVSSPPSASLPHLSAPPPKREDIVPETTLSPTGLAATSFGQQSNLLRDLREIVRREIRAQRIAPVE